MKRLMACAIAAFLAGGNAMEMEGKIGNLSKAKRERLVAEVGAIRAFLEKSAGTDTNATRLLEFAAEVEKEVRGKKYGLVFEEHRERVDVELDENLPVLTEVKGRFLAAKAGGRSSSTAENATAREDTRPPLNFLIEGDNLAALKLLEKTHRGKIDLIYIDPPYNTGNKDFIYNDSYVDKTDTFRHSKWLSFMQKRLEIAKRLLSDKGVIFISIDDNEQAALKLLCDDVFGIDNFIANMIWKSKSGGGSDVSQIATDHEYVIAYARSIAKAEIKNDMGATVTTVYNREDEKGRYSLDRLDKQSLGYQSSLDFPIIGPDGKTYVVEHKDPKVKKARWRWGKDTVAERYDELVFIYPYVYTKNYEKKDGQKPRSVLFDERFGRTRTGSTDLRKVIGNQSIFTYPKPVSLLRYLAEIGSSHDSTILDFFAGSGTTGHAVMKLNAEDGGKRKFILVTNNENGICEKVTYERLKRVIKKEGYVAALKYFRIEYVPFGEDGYWELADKLLGHIRELVEIENGIDFAHDRSVAIVLTDEELAKFAAKLGERSRGMRDLGGGRGATALPRVLYKGHNVMLGGKVKSALAKCGIEVRTIPDYYYPELEGER